MGAANSDSPINSDLEIAAPYYNPFVKLKVVVG
jgi:hypothetical protein